MSPPSPADVVEPDPRPGARFELSDLKRAFGRFQKDQITDYAAALTYFFLMSLAPAVLVAVALLGVLGQESLITDATDYLRDAGAPPETVNVISSIIEGALKQQSAAITSLVFGVVIGINGASGAFAAAGRALNKVWRVEEGRGFVRRKLNDIGWTLVVLVLVVITMVLIFLGGGLVNDIFGAIGLGDTAATIWKIVRWPAALLTATTIYAVVYYAAPNVEVRRFQFITPGAVFGVVIWIVASAAFFLYVSNFSYGAAYGAIAGVVILLVWLWLTNSVMLFGAELNAVIDLRRSPHLPETYDGPPLPEKEPAEG
jgi:membrane protein